MLQLRAICARISGNELPAAECENLTGGLPDGQGVAACQRLDLIPRSAYISLGLSCLAQAESLEDLVREVATQGLSADRFRIDVLSISQERHISGRQAVIEIANVLEGAPDLDNPIHRFAIVVQDRCLWFGEVLNNCQHSYRKHDAKPYRTTSSLPSRLARALVNLVPPATQTILDPFCGTGSILLEAYAIGLTAFGGDVNPKMTGMSRLNLEHFGYPVPVEWMDVLDCQRRVDAIVTDLPYGRILKIERLKLKSIFEHAVQLATHAIYLAEEDLSTMMAEAGYKKIEVYAAHKSHALTRVVHRASVAG